MSGEREKIKMERGSEGERGKEGLGQIEPFHRIRGKDGAKEEGDGE